MDPLTGSIVVVLGKYALEKGSELGKEIGPKALETAKEMFGMVLDRVKKVDPRTAQKFPENPEGYKAPLADALDETLQANPDLAAQLEEMLAQYEQAVKEHATATGQVFKAEVKGSGAVAQGAGAVAAGKGGVAVGRDVRGGISLGGSQAGEDKNK